MRQMKNATFKLFAVTLAAAFVTLCLALSSDAKQKSAAPQVSVAAGEKIFKKNCAMCHFADKSDTKIGPGLKGLFANKQLPLSHRPATEANVHVQIDKGSPKAKPMPMPGFADKLSPADIQKLLDYLKTL
jgi:mono/diheme cytochrome c family protein